MAMTQEGPRPVKVPSELRTAPRHILEEYVHSRLMQFCPAFASRIGSGVGPQQLQQVAVEVLQALPSPDYSDALASRELQLVFRHDCQSLGCLDLQCVLCEHNPNRRCSVNFAQKYLVNDVLHAKCDAPIRVEIIDRATGQPISEDLPGFSLELCILDGNMYDGRCSERPGEDLGHDMETCTLVLNNKASALLVPGPGGTLNSENKVVVPLTKGIAVLPDVHVSDSSEALLSGRKPPFRLLARAVAAGGSPALNVRSAVSEGFVVATRRTRTAGKVDIPNVDDHVGKLEHMGRETVKKLQDIRGSALAAGVDIQVPDNCVNRVGEFRKLALLAEADGHLRQKLQQVLKLSKEKWDEARDHAMRAVVADNRMRIWYADKSSMDVGLLFTCRLGSVELDRPVGLLTKKASDGAQTTMEATLMAQQTPAQRDQVRALQPKAAAAWWQYGHPGWAIYPVDSDQFLATGALDPAALPSNDQVLNSGPPPVMPPPGAFPFANPAFANAFMGGVPAMPQANEALLRAIGAGTYQLGGPGPGALGGAFGMPPILPPAPALSGLGPLGGGGGMPHHEGGPASPNATTTSPFAMAGGEGVQQAMPPPPILRPGGPGQPGISQPPQQQQQNQEAHHNNGAHGDVQQGHGGLMHPPENRLMGPGGTPNLDGAPSFTLANLQSMLGSDFKLPLSLQNFPSLPGAGMLPGSGDLEALLAHAGGGDPANTFYTARFPSLALAKSLDLHDGDKTAAMSPPITGGRGHEGSGGAGGGGMNGMQRKHSGLESMQSIEHALADSQRPQSVHDAMDAAVAAIHQQRGSLAGNKRK